MSKLSPDEKLISNAECNHCNGILCSFIRFVVEESYEMCKCSGDCGKLLNWISTEDWDVISLSKMLPTLLKCNGNIRFVDENGKTILHAFLESCKGKNYSTQKLLSAIQYLLNSGISIKATDANGNTPLHHAMELRRIDLVEMLLKNYTNINACNERGDTILHLLANNNYYNDFSGEKCGRLAQLMVSKGADVNLQNKVGWTPVHVAAKKSKFCMLKVFVSSKPNLKLCTNNGENALVLFCKHSPRIHIKLVELLLNGGSDVNVSDADGYSSLHYASIHGQQTTVKSLIKAGAKIDAESADGVTPLHLAVLRSPRIARYLMQKGVNVRCRETRFGFNLIHMAALQSDIRILCLLLGPGFDVNDGGNYGITALHLASFRGNVDSVRMLIERGADVRCRDNVTNSTALHYALKREKFSDFIKIISGAEREPFWIPVKRMYKDTGIVVTLLAQSGANVNAKDAFGRTPLHLATVHDDDEPKINLKLVKTVATNLFFFEENVGPVGRLFKYGAHMNVQDDEGKLPLHNALTTGHNEALDSLLEFGVDVDDADTIRIVYSCKQNLRKQVLKYNVKLRAAQLPVSNSYIAHTDNWIFKDYYFKCLEEVENMKSHLVDDTNSLYDLLHMNWKRRVHLAQSVPLDVQEQFPLYYGIIQASCREALQRKLLFEEAKSALYQITKVDLPDLCSERIFDYLKNRYLGALVDAAFNDDR